MDSILGITMTELKFIPSFINMKHLVMKMTVVLVAWCIMFMSIGPLAHSLPTSKDNMKEIKSKFIRECIDAHDIKPVPGISCGFENECGWSWDEASDSKIGFQVITGEEAQKIVEKDVWAFSAPNVDAQNFSTGHFLHLAFQKEKGQLQEYSVKSPWFSDSKDTCSLKASLHMKNMKEVSFKMILKTENHSIWAPMSSLGGVSYRWQQLQQNIGKQRQPFQIILAVSNSHMIPSHFSIDDIELVDCFPSLESCNKSCSERDFKCSNNICIHKNKICDLNRDCLHGEDELQDCESVPANTSCTFESGWCGWTVISESNITWERTNNPSLSKPYGPQADHTFGNGSGHYLLVNMKVANAFTDRTRIISSVFAPPPAYNHDPNSEYFESCQLRFFYHMFGPHVGTLDAELVPLNPRSKWPKPIRFWEQIGENQGNMWHRVSAKLPRVTTKYRLQFTAVRGRRGHAGDIGLDDISLSPECFGIGVSPSSLNGYNYYLALKKLEEPLSESLPPNVTMYRFGTCNETGSQGPDIEKCKDYYKRSMKGIRVEVDMEEDLRGVQIWTVPESRHYMLIAKGASGGRGAILNQITSHGSIVKTAMFLQKGEKIYILVGQEGFPASLCQFNSSSTNDTNNDNTTKNSINRKCTTYFSQKSTRSQDNAMRQLIAVNNLIGGGGGGGGATYIFKINEGEYIPILVAGGGGGLAYNASINISPYGKGLNMSKLSRSGSSQPHGAGGGGGWDSDVKEINLDALNIPRMGTYFKKDNETMYIAAGMSLVKGKGLGGYPCSLIGETGPFGGFGGGGGGCTAGGGGGGFSGGDAHVSLSSNGEGGSSLIGKESLYAAVQPGGHAGPGEFIAIPAFTGCNCEFMCIIKDEFELSTGCVCPHNWILKEDGITCVALHKDLPTAYLVMIILIGALTFFFVGLLCFCLYNKYQRQKMAILGRKVLGGPELQLNRLRAQSGPGAVLTEYNPNYEFGGETFSINDLKSLPRQNLRLVKPLGQGAFGEVYQGFYKNRAGDAVEMPVAVKTLPELSSNQAELDFLMEALIMSKFNHPNIVHFIGVCFDKHPRFIILELLAGGDLKTFLRESRPKPDKTTPLSMKDLLLAALDVAKGCKYLEDNHFIHRDIAARNCLLTTKGPGRTVKIADFGMARDIYRADYYKKGGRAMLPVKWMPPEAFLDGMFTSKTDVWSYGVLMWEIFSLGYMPYPGRGNQDVMQLVTNGGRLDAPTNCPEPVYNIMKVCWHPHPHERPTFSEIIELVSSCAQNPSVVTAPLPVFQRPPSSERDVTLMRPSNSDEVSCLRIVQGHPPLKNLKSNSQAGDYLVPLAPPFKSPNRGAGVDKNKENQFKSLVSSPSGDNDNFPESQSSETILDAEGVSCVGGEQGESSENRKTPTSTGNHAQSKEDRVSDKKSNASSAPSSSKDGHVKRNSIEAGVTLELSNLAEMAPSKPTPYVNVGMRKKTQPPGNVSPNEEEIRC